MVSTTLLNLRLGPNRGEEGVGWGEDVDMGGYKTFLSQLHFEPTFISMSCASSDDCNHLDSNSLLFH